MLPYRLVQITPYLMVGYTDYVVYPVVQFMQFILKVHQLLFSEDLGKTIMINSSTCICIHIASHNFSACRIGDAETVLSALNNVVRLIVVTGNEPFLLVSAISEVLYCSACHI